MRTLHPPREAGYCACAYDSTLRSRGDSAETEGERGRKAGSMKKGASCERKPAWIPSGKAGAEGSGAGGGVRVDSGWVPQLLVGAWQWRFPRVPRLLGGPGGWLFLASSPNSPKPLGPQEGTIASHLPVAAVENKRVVTSGVCLPSLWVGYVGVSRSGYRGKSLPTQWTLGSPNQRFSRLFFSGLTVLKSMFWLIN